MFSQNMERLVELAKKADALSDSKLQRLFSVLSVEWDAEIAEAAEQILLYRVRQAFLDPFWPNIANNGEFAIGLSKGTEFGIDRNMLSQGMLVVGRSGAGKTNLFMLLMRQMSEKGLPFLAFDFKRDYRHLMREHPDLVVIPWENLKFNPLRPPEGVAPERWMQIFCDVYCHSNALLHGSKNFLFKHLHELYNRYGVLDGRNRYPTMHEMAGILTAYGRPMSAKDSWYRSTVINRVQAMVLAIGNILDCESGFDIAGLMTKSAVLELDGMMEDMQNFLVEMLLTWIYHYRLAHGHRGELRHCIFFDEAKRVFDINKERMPEAGIPVIDIITDRAREFGEALIVADQEPSKLTHSIRANTGTKIMLSLGSGTDIVEMSATMGLSREQTEVCHRLSIGEGIVKIAGQRPLPVQIGQALVQKDVNDDEVEERLNRLQLAFRPRELLEPTTLKATERRLPTDAEQLLIDIERQPFVPITERYARLRLSNEAGIKARRVLLIKGFAQEIEVNTGRRGGRPKVLDSTDRGREYLQAKGHATATKEKGGIEHRYWQNKAKEFLTSWGCKVSLEVGIGKRSVDVIALCPNGKAVAVEIAMNPKYELENLKKDIELGFDEIITACRDEPMLGTIKRMAEEYFGQNMPQNIRFCLVKEFSVPGKANGISASVSGRRNIEELETKKGEGDEQQS